MKRIIAGALAASLLIGTSAAAWADSYHPYPSQSYSHNDHYDAHNGSHNGDYGHYNQGHNDRGTQVRVTYGHPTRVARVDWDRGRRIDYRYYRLPPPRPGYEWRYVNGQFVEGAIIGGLVATLLVAAVSN